MGDGDDQGVVKIADFGLARIYQAPLKYLSENGVGFSLFWLRLIFNFFTFKSPCYFLQLVSSRLLFIFGFICLPS